MPVPYTRSALFFPSIQTRISNLCTISPISSHYSSSKQISPFASPDPNYVLVLSTTTLQHAKVETSLQPLHDYWHCRARLGPWNHERGTGTLVAEVKKKDREEKEKEGSKKEIRGK